MHAQSKGCLILNSPAFLTSPSDNMQLFGNCFCFGTAACTEAFEECDCARLKKIGIVHCLHARCLYNAPVKFIGLPGKCFFKRRKRCFAEAARGGKQKDSSAFRKAAELFSIELLITVTPLMKTTSVAIIISISLFRGFVIMPRYDFCVKNFAAFHVDPMRKILYNKSIRRGFI